MDKAITLYALPKSSSTPAWAKAAIIAALGYFICPLDAIPDFLLQVGFVDDLAVMAAVLMNLQKYHSEEIRKEVERIKAKFS